MTQDADNTTKTATQFLSEEIEDFFAEMKRDCDQAQQDYFDELWQLAESGDQDARERILQLQIDYWTKRESRR